MTWRKTVSFKRGSPKLTVEAQNRREGELVRQWLTLFKPPLSNSERWFEKSPRHYACPPSPPILGGKTLIFGYLPPELGGRGGANAGMNETFHTASELGLPKVIST